MVKTANIVPYSTNIPRKFVLEDGSVIELPASEITTTLTKKPLFESYLYPVSLIPTLVDHLKSIHSFTVPVPAIPEFEKYGLSKKITPIWELHIRIWGDGKMISHVEIARDYFEHLGDNRLFVVYEPYSYLAPYFPKQGETNVLGGMLLKYRGSWVTSIIENYEVSLPPAGSFTEWVPVVGTIATIGALVGLIYALTRPPKTKDEEDSHD